LRVPRPLRTVFRARDALRCETLERRVLVDPLRRLAFAGARRPDCFTFLREDPLTVFRRVVVDFFLRATLVFFFAVLRLALAAGLRAAASGVALAMVRLAFGLGEAAARPSFRTVCVRGI